MRLLLVEDDSKIAENIRSYFKKKDIVVDIATNMEEAGYEMEEESFDCIILDWMLPDGDGISIAKKFRAKGDSTPIIILTANSQIEDKVEGFSSGADDYLTKPFAMAELEARVHALIRRTTTAKSSPIVSCGNISLDLNRCTVAVKGDDIQLSPREYSLLEYLMLHMDIVVSRENILRHVWGEYDDLMSNTVDVHISNLRKKLSQESSAEIRTIINKGYMVCTI